MEDCDLHMNFRNKAEEDPKSAIKYRLKEAEKLELSSEELHFLKQQIEQHLGICRIRLGDAGAVKDDPMKIALHPSEKVIKPNARKYYVEQ